jgi:hypothetical protein
MSLHHKMPNAVVPWQASQHLQLSLSVLVTDLLQLVAAAAATCCGPRPCCRPAGRSPLRTARAAARLLLFCSRCQPAGWPGALLLLARQPGPAILLCSRCQPVGWPCTFWAGPRGPAGPASAPGPFTVRAANRALVGLLASSSRPRRPTGGLEFHRSQSFQGFASAQGRLTNEPAQTLRLPVGPSCRAAWARNPRGAESRLIAHACNEAHHVYSVSTTVSSQLATVRRKKK